MFEILRTNQVEATLKEILNNQYSQDRMYTIDPLIRILKNLLDNNINEVPDFASLFKRIGLNSKQITNCIKSFVNYYNLCHKQLKIKWFKQRSWRQLKYYHKNFVIAKLVYEHEKCFLDYLRLFVSRKISNIKEIDQFISEFCFKIDKIKKQLINNNTIQIKTLESNDDTQSNFLNNEDEDNFVYSVVENDLEDDIFDDNQMFFY